MRAKGLAKHLAQTEHSGEVSCYFHSTVGGSERTSQAEGTVSTKAKRRDMTQEGALAWWEFTVQERGRSSRRPDPAACAHWAGAGTLSQGSQGQCRV